MSRESTESPCTAEPSGMSALRFATGFILVLAILVWCGLKPHYEGIMTYGGNTDDVRATMFVSGVGVPGGPSDDLLYSNRLIGIGLKQLYSAHPDVPWYGFYLTGCHLLAHFAICFAWCRVVRDSRTRIAVVAFLIGMGSYFWVSLQFTMTSAMMALAGVSLIASAIFRESTWDPNHGKPPRSELWQVILGWCFVMVAGLIRWHALLMMGVTLAPALLVPALCFYRKLPVRRHLLISVFAITTIFGMQIGSQRWLESRSDWKEFREFEHPLASLINSRHAQAMILKKEGQPLSEETKHDLASVGWSHNDARLLFCWLYFDREVYSTESISRLNARILPALPGPKKWFQVIRGIALVLVSDRHVLLLLLLSGAIAAAESNRVRFGVSAVWTGALLLLAALYLLLKMQHHVLYSIASGAFFVSLAVSVCNRIAAPIPTGSIEAGESGRRRGRFVTPLLLVAAGVMAIHLAWSHFEESKRGTAYREQFLQSMSKLERGPDRIYIINLQFPFQRVSPFDTMSDWRDLRFLYTDGDIRSPRYEQFLRENDIDDLTTAIYRDPRVRLICHESRLPMLAEFLRDHRGVEVEWAVDLKLPYLTVFHMTERVGKSE